MQEHLLNCLINVDFIELSHGDLFLCSRSQNGGMKVTDDVLLRMSLCKRNLILHDILFGA